VIKSLGRAVAWFIDGLVEAVAAVEETLRRRGRLSLVHVEDGYAVEHQDGRREPTRLRLEAENGTTRLAPEAPALALRGHDVDIVLPSDELLVRSLDPLPAESRPYLDGIVRHQLERLAPWRSDDVLSTYRAAPLAPGDSRLAVTIAATARSLHNRLIVALRALGPRELRLVYRDGTQTDSEFIIPVNGDTAAHTRHRRIRVAVLGVLAAVALAGVLASVWIGWRLQQTETALAEIEQAVAERRKALVAAGQQRPTVGRDAEALLTQRKNEPFSVLAIEALSQALPDDTWLSEVRIAEGRIRLIGVSHSVAELVPQIQASKAFAEATFFAPTTRLPEGEGDRFHLEARLLAAGAKP
jgi:general secretion pathway protein L